MLVTPVPITTLVKRVQYWNTKAPILVTLLGIVTLRRPVCAKALARIFHSRIEQRSGEGVKRVVITQPNENTTHRFFCDRL
jgi:hypothetical protein